MNLLVLPGSTWEILGIFLNFEENLEFFKEDWYNWKILIKPKNTLKKDISIAYKYVMYKTQSILRTMEWIIISVWASLIC